MAGGQSRSGRLCRPKISLHANIQVIGAIAYSRAIGRAQLAACRTRAEEQWMMVARSFHFVPISQHRRVAVTASSLAPAGTGHELIER